MTRFGKRVQPICLPSTTDPYDDLQSCTVAGSGPIFFTKLVGSPMFVFIFSLYIQYIHILHLCTARKKKFVTSPTLILTLANEVMLVLCQLASCVSLSKTCIFFAPAGQYRWMIWLQNFRFHQLPHGCQSEGW